MFLIKHRSKIASGSRSILVMLGYFTLLVIRVQLSHAVVARIYANRVCVLILISEPVDLVGSSAEVYSFL